MCRLVAGDDRQRRDVGADGGERGREHEAVRLVHLTELERAPRGASRRPSRGSPRGRRAHTTWATPTAASAELRRAEAHTPEHDVARTRHRRAAHMRTQRHGFENVDTVVMLDNVLMGTTVGAAGRPRRSRSPSPARLERALRHRLAAIRSTTGSEPGRSAARTAVVHRRAGERRQVDERVVPAVTRPAASSEVLAPTRGMRVVSTSACACSSVRRSRSVHNVAPCPTR